MTIYKQGQLVVYRNDKKDEIIIMINDKGYEGIVLHSDGLVSSGTILKIDDSYEPYVGTVNITAAAATAAEQPKKIEEEPKIVQEVQQLP